MKKTILIAPNSFKECADSVEISELLETYLSKQKDLKLIKKPISDGGDGFLNVCRFHFGGEIRKYQISSAYDDSLLECPVLYVKCAKDIYIESAEVLGLKVVQEKYRNPLRLSSKGLGELLLKINQDVKNGIIEAQKVNIGIGGTATIDMGLGMMSKVGLKLIDSTGRTLTVLPENLMSAREIEFVPEEFSFDIIPIIDVSNSLLGKDGGIWTYGQQKGASEADVVTIEKGFTNILNLLKNNNLGFSSDSLSGAGGGIPTAFQIFYNTHLMKSSEFILSKLKVAENANEIDYLITGEGAFDHQSNFKKGAGVIIENLNSKVDKIFLVCGKIELPGVSGLPKNVVPIEFRKYFKNKQESINNYKVGLEKASYEILKEINF